MTLRRKILWSLGLIMVTATALLSVMSNLVVLRGFELLENREAVEDAKRLRQMVDCDLMDLRGKVQDLATWDQACQFIQQPTDRFIQDNFSAPSFSGLRLSMVMALDPEGRPVFSRAMDEKQQEVPMSADLLTRVTNDKRLFEPRTNGKVRATLLIVDSRMLMTAWAPIVSTDGSGSPRGVIVYGRWLDEKQTQQYADAMRMNVTLVLTDPTLITPKKIAGAPEPVNVQVKDANLIAADQFLRGLDGRPLARLGIEKPRSVYRYGLRIVHGFFWGILGLSLVMGGASYVLLSKVVLGRLSRLGQGIDQLRRTGSLSVRFVTRGHDELSSLSDQLNRLLDNLQIHQEALSRSEAQYRAIVESSVELICRFRPDGTLTFVNEVVCRCFGRTSSQLIGSNAVDFIFPQDQPLYATSLAALAPNNPLLHMDIRMLVKDGMVRWQQWTLTANFDSNGQVAELQGVGRDVTELRQAQQMLEQAYAELELRVFHRTGELAKTNESLQLEIADRKRIEQRLRENNLHDHLTGLPNRLMMMERLTRCLDLAHTNPQFGFAVLFLDLDRFKVINDSLGHLIGDQLLITVAHKLESTLNRLAQSTPGLNYSVARLGGDEFTILIEGIGSQRQVTQLAHQIQTALTVSYNLSGHEVFTTMSMGIAIGDSTYEAAEELLRDADTAMYQAKSAGKACSALFDQQMHDKVTSRLQVENDLRKALDRSELIPYYQPLVYLDTGRLYGFETLLRWNHPTSGLVSPDDFIPVAEESGLIIPIGLWVLQESVRQLRRWQDQFKLRDSLSVSVNLSPRQLGDPDLIRRVTMALSESGIVPKTLKLEITETSIVADAAATLPLLQHLRRLGVGLHMDDFGTGYSSLSCLHQFPIDGLKIDRAFIRNMSQRRDYAAIIQAIVTLAHNLNIHVVAEGIEEAEQLAQLQALECDVGQGYYFAKPMPAMAATDFIRQFKPHALMV